MTHFVGAWSFSGGPVSAHLSAAQKHRLLAPLGAYSGLVEHHLGALWCYSDPAKWIQQGPACCLTEGYLTSALSQADCAALNSGHRRLPEGHYVLLHAQPSELCLLRSLSGGERLYYLQTEGLLLFSTTLRPLLAYQSSRQFNPQVRQDILLSGLPVCGAASLAHGIEEVLAGHRLQVTAGVCRQHWHWGNILQPKTGPCEPLATTFRGALAQAVEQSIGGQSRVAVSLSGGIDSAAVAALAVEAVGAKQVVAFTYEFDDPEHATETAHAQLVCRHLGIQQHEVFKISLEAFITAIPETVWRSESVVHWPKAFMLPVARHIQAAGFDRFLCGFGIGSHMSFLRDFAALMAWLPKPNTTLKFWKWLQFHRPSWLGQLEHVHPALAPVNRRLYYLLLRQLQVREQITALADFYPQQIQALLTTPATRTEADFAHMSLEQGFQYHSFAHLMSCIDVTRWEKPLREIGAQRISPAHFAACLPYAYLPYQPPAFVWSPQRRLRPGKHLLRLAMAGTLPEAILTRKKSWADAIISPTWKRVGVRWMQQAVSGSPAFLGELEQAEALSYWDKRAPQASVTALRFWHKIFIESDPRADPPSWQDLFSTRF